MIWLGVAGGILATLIVLVAWSAVASNRWEEELEDEMVARAERLYWLRQANTILSQERDIVSVTAIYELADLLELEHKEGLNGTDSTQ